MHALLKFTPTLCYFYTISNMCGYFIVHPQRHSKILRYLTDL
nr:MAG TPA: hypothetical protein [Bacteriophage sp.]